MFPLGRIVATPGALEAMEAAHVAPASLIVRHQSRDWGEIDPGDIGMNEAALENGDRILSVYHIGKGDVIWIITEWDRSVTTLLLPEDY